MVWWFHHGDGMQAFLSAFHFTCRSKSSILYSFSSYKCKFLTRFKCEKVKHWTLFQSSVKKFYSDIQFFPHHKIHKSYPQFKKISFYFPPLCVKISRLYFFSLVDDREQQSCCFHWEPWCSAPRLCWLCSCHRSLLPWKWLIRALCLPINYNLHPFSPFSFPPSEWNAARRLQARSRK